MQRVAELQTVLLMDSCFFSTIKGQCFIILRSTFKSFSSICEVLFGFTGGKLPQTTIQPNKYLPQSFNEMECVLLQALFMDILKCQGLWFKYASISFHF